MSRAIRWLRAAAARYVVEIGGLSLLLALLWLVVACWPAHPPAAGQLSRKQVRRVAARRDAALAAIPADTARAYRAATSARRSYAAGVRTQSQAIHFHAQSRVQVRPAADSTADRLRCILAAY